MRKINLLHLSDIHFDHPKNKRIEDFYSTICKDLKQNNQKIDLVICTGDIVDGKCNSKPAAFKKAISFFEKLRTRINKENLYNKHELEVSDFLFVPGNHDVNRGGKKEKRYEAYNKFLEDFYGREKSTLYSPENKFLYVIKVFEESKIAFVGLNSCMGEKKISERETSWIESLNFDSLDLDPKNSKKIKTLLKNSKKEYDDYGEVSTDQILNAFDDLKEKVIDEIENYQIVCFFHHHIYPFPEIYDEYGDSSMIRNFSTVLHNLNDYNVRFVFHGHKHLPISRLVTNNNYFKEPEKSLHVFSTGTLGLEGERGFEVAEIYPPNQFYKAEISKFIYTSEELQDVYKITIPPKYGTKDHNQEELLDILRRKDNVAYEWYEKINSCDNTAHKYHIDTIRKNIENVIFKFEGVHRDLNNNPDLIVTILATLHQRIRSWENYSNRLPQKTLDNDLKEFLKKSTNFTDEYVKSYTELLSVIRKNLFSDPYKKFFNNKNYNPFKKNSAYVALIAYLTDLHLVISNFEEDYFKKERIEHKINIKISSKDFTSKVSNRTIELVGDEDRRAATISFECHDPTVHKACVLIVKDFEERINHIEEALKFLRFKLYYVRPKVKKVGYEMDNYNFEAYIPTLLPLLTGDNLYKQKEVFLRELIQNCFDAILLREKVDGSSFLKTIRIIFKEDPERKSKVLQIIDEGIGMDLYKIERYFTSIGRSFYKSEDFKEFQKENKIQYKALSNFGIGFLSVFMVAQEVKVDTKSVESEEEISLYIPNYEGCFFINKSETLLNTGTTITLYENPSFYKWNVKEMINYIKRVFLDFQLQIDIENHIDNDFFGLPKYRLRRGNSEIRLFCPIVNDKVESLDVETLLNKNYIDKYAHGISLFLNGDGSHTYLNSGILLSHDQAVFDLNLVNTVVYYNFPSSWLEVDVAREVIKGFKKDSITEKDILKVWSFQSNQIFEHIETINPAIGLSVMNNLSFTLFSSWRLVAPICLKCFQLCLSENENEYLFTYEKSDAENPLMDLKNDLFFILFERILGDVVNAQVSIPRLLMEEPDDLHRIYRSFFRKVSRNIRWSSRNTMFNPLSEFFDSRHFRTETSVDYGKISFSSEIDKEPFVMSMRYKREKGNIYENIFYKYMTSYINNFYRDRVRYRMKDFTVVNYIQTIFAFYWFLSLELSDRLKIADLENFCLRIPKDDLHLEKK